MLDTHTIQNCLEQHPAGNVCCDNIQNPVRKERYVSNMSDLPDRIVLYINDSENGLSNMSIRETLNESEWSWLIRDVFVKDQGCLYPAIDVVAEGNKITVIYDTEIAEEILKVGGIL